MSIEELCFHFILSQWFTEWTHYIVLLNIENVELMQDRTYNFNFYIRITWREKSLVESRVTFSHGLLGWSRNCQSLWHHVSLSSDQNSLSTNTGMTFMIDPTSQTILVPLLPIDTTVSLGRHFPVWEGASSHDYVVHYKTAIMRYIKVFMENGMKR